MVQDDPREATEAAIERTERERLPPHRIDGPHGELDAVVQWQAGGSTFCCFVRGDGTELLVAFGDEGVAAFELDLDELRENLERCGVLESDVDVISDDLVWFGGVDPRYREDESVPAELAGLRGGAPFEYLGEIDRPGVRAVVNDLRERYRIGTAVAGEFGLGDDDVLRDCWESDGLEYERGDLSLGVEFLRSEAVVAFLEDATPEEYLDDPTFREQWHERGGSFNPTARSELPISFSRVRTERLDGLVAETLLGGGAYNDFRGDYEEAKALGRAFSHAFRDGKRTFEQTAYVGRGQWSNWFVFTDVWDVTIVLEDREADRIRLFMATCTD